jgi:hypothetical protein
MWHQWNTVTQQTKLIKKVHGGRLFMQHANFNTGRVSAIINLVIDKLMVASGVFALVWILAFLLVGIIDKGNTIMA